MKGGLEECIKIAGDWGVHDGFYAFLIIFEKPLLCASDADTSDGFAIWMPDLKKKKGFLFGRDALDI